MGHATDCCFDGCSNTMLGYEWEDGIFYEKWMEISCYSVLFDTVCDVWAENCQELEGKVEVFYEKRVLETHIRQYYQL